MCYHLARYSFLVPTNLGDIRLNESVFVYIMNLDSDSHGKLNMTSLLFVYVVFGPILHILIIYYTYQDAV